MNKLITIFASKAARVFVFGLVSIMLPVYVSMIGGSPFLVGATLAVVIAGNIFSNILLTWYGNILGRRRALLTFSLLMTLSGVLLFAFTYLPIILFACFIGNISTTGTEAGPFQSIETGVLPSIAPGREARMFGFYNLIGYSTASIGALASSIPAYFANSIAIFHYLFLLYGIIGLLLFAIYSGLGNIETKAPSDRKGLAGISKRARSDIWKLSALNSMDAFGGGFVSQSLLSYWFFYVYHVSLLSLGPIFLVVNVITAVSTLGATFVAEKIGNLRTMVFSHLVSNTFLIAIPLAGSLPGSLLFLFLRQSVSQMDVPTRQAFMAHLFTDFERVPANTVTNTFRSGTSILGAPLTGVLIGLGLSAVPIFAGSLSKIAYDILIYFSYRKRAR